MQDKEVNSLGHTAKKSFPSTVIEFNSNAKNGLGDKPDAILDMALEQYIAHDFLTKAREAFVFGLPEIKGEDGLVTHPAIKGLEDLTGIHCKFGEVKDKDGKVKKDKDGQPLKSYATADGGETEGKYYKRVLTLQSGPGKKFETEEKAHEHYTPLFASIIHRLPVDLSEIVREAKEKKLPENCKLTAATLIARGTFATVVTNIAKKLGEKLDWKPTTPVPADGKMFSGVAKVNVKDKKSGKVVPTEVSYNVLESDAISLGWLIKRNLDYDAEQARQALMTE